jgi:hypothetical protein
MTIPFNHEGNLVQSPSEKEMFSGPLCQLLVIQWLHNMMLVPESVQRRLVAATLFWALRAPDLGNSPCIELLIHILYMANHGNITNASYTCTSILAK